MMLTLPERQLFVGKFNALVERATLADVARMAGLLMCWLEDLVKSPPPPPPPPSSSSRGAAAPAGEVKDARADEYLFHTSHCAMTLQTMAGRASDFPECIVLYPFLSRPAQAAWDRLVTRHLPRLPLPARISLRHALPHVTHLTPDVAAAAMAELVPLLETGTLAYNIGRGLTSYRGWSLYEIMVSITRRVPENTLFDRPFAGAPRRLALLLMYDLLGNWDPRASGRDFTKGRVVRVSPADGDIRQACTYRSTCTMKRNP
jgi:hypothetical protein